MAEHFMSDLTRRGVHAARAGNKAQARHLLAAATKADDTDIVAWWWLSQVVDDRKVSHKCLERAQAVAAENEEGSTIYKGLLRESGAPTLPRFRLAEKSKS